MTAEQKNTPLHLASEDGDLERVQTLLAAGADPNAKGEHDRTPLHLAAGIGWEEIVQVLLDAGADPNVAEPDSQHTPLHLACLGAEEIVRMLLAAGGDPKAKDGYGRTPLDLAVEVSEDIVYGGFAREFVEIVKMLLNTGAYDNMDTALKSKIWHWAVSTDPHDAAYRIGTAEIIKRVFSNPRRP